MSEHSSSDSSNPQQEAGAGSKHPPALSRWQQVKYWLLSVLIIVVVSAVVEKVFEHETIEYVKEVNESFVHHVKEVDPFFLAANFYGYLLTGVPPQPRQPHLPERGAFEIPRPPQSSERGAGIVISQRTKRLAPLIIDEEIYGWRHLIENFFCKLKDFKRISQRADKTDQSFAAMIYLCSAVINSR